MDARVSDKPANESHKDYRHHHDKRRQHRHGDGSRRTARRYRYGPGAGDHLYRNGVIQESGVSAALLHPAKGVA